MVNRSGQKEIYSVMKTYLPREELDQWSGIGKDEWIKMRFNRSYSNPLCTNDMEAYFVPTAPSSLVDITTASDDVAKDIASRYNNLYVCMSGGIDSEWVAKSFHRNGIPFTPIIYEIEDIMGNDTWWAHKWCAEHGYKPVVLKEYMFRFVTGLINMCRTNCLRTPGGPYMMSKILQFVNDQGGHMVTGAAFPEVFPDPNLSYMKGRFLDNKLMNPDGTVKNSGWLLHESDFTLGRLLKGHPWNFLSWTPEIVLSYISSRNQGTSEFNKATIFNCAPRPKAIGIPDWVWRSKDASIKKMLRIKNRVGTSEVDFIGPTDQLIAILTSGDINAK